MLIIHGIAAFNDNYIWLFHQQDCTEAYVVDPGDADPVINFLEASELILKGVLLTHHHFDHSGGIDTLCSRYPGLQVWASAHSQVKKVTFPLVDNQTIHINTNCAFSVLAVPGHTLDHLCFFYDDPEQPVAFAGDTLFAGGCGRVFEGNMTQMHNSLQRLAGLPANTKVYCAHEYTLSNLEFAIQVEPDNTTLQERFRTIKTARKWHKPTVPSILSEELATNPFLRCHVDAVQAAAFRHNPNLDKNTEKPEEIFATIRKWKDSA